MIQGIFYATIIMGFIAIFLVAFVFALLALEELRDWRENKKKFQRRVKL